MQVISEAGIVLGSTAGSAEEAILECGQLLIALGSVTPEYLAAMFEREQIMSSAIGEGLAIPHGTELAREFVNFDQLVLLQLEKPIPWGDQTVELVIGIASKANTHVGLLSKIAQMATEGGLGNIQKAQHKHEILSLLTSL